MKDKGNSNIGFFLPLFLFAIIGGFILLNIEKGDAIIFFSQHRNGVWNVFFKYFTLLGEAYVYLVGVIVFLFIQFRKAIFFPILGIFVTIVSHYTKTYFRHPRPFLFFNKLDILETIPLVTEVALHGGHTSFPSGHTMSAFALYSFFAFMTQNRKLQFLFFIIALLVGISRIYLVQHFFEDVYLGAIIGAVIGWITYHVQRRLTFGSKRWIL